MSLRIALPVLLRQPDHRAHDQLLRPLHFVDQPRRLDARQLGAGGAVDVERRVRMALKERRRDFDVDLAFDGALHDGRLVLAGRDDRDLARVENRRDAHRDRFARHVLLAEEVGGRVAARHGVERDERVRLSAPEPGSLKPMWPVLPMPRI